ncbi:hypothetical protein ACIBL3_44995 [Kribbella sp. NPDC050124]|uniref:hypothetical protein n=1 Tax=Kribbella sp. NPDC050124 TaxID=3364114 RepID=UPI00378896DB
MKVLRSEWTKLTSLRSNWLVLAGVPVAFTGLSALIGANSRGPVDPTLAVGGGFLLYALAVGVLGALMMTGEHQSGLIRSTLAAVPRRLPVLWAKAALLVIAVGPILVAAYFGAFLANQAFVDDPLSLSDPGILRSLFGAAGATIAAGLIGLALGTILRSTPASIAAYVVGLVVLPPVLFGALPADAQDTVLPYFPTLALQGMFQVGEPGEAMFGPGVSGLVVLGWVILMLAGATVVLGRRDV